MGRRIQDSGAGSQKENAVDGGTVFAVLRNMKAPTLKRVIKNNLITPMAWLHTKYPFETQLIGLYCHEALQADLDERGVDRFCPKHRTFLLTFGLVHAVNSGGWRGYFESALSADMGTTFEALREVRAR